MPPYISIVRFSHIRYRRNVFHTIRSLYYLLIASDFDIEPIYVSQHLQFFNLTYDVFSMRLSQNLTRMNEISLNLVIALIHMYRPFHSLHVVYVTQITC